MCQKFHLTENNLAYLLLPCMKNSHGHMVVQEANASQHAQHPAGDMRQIHMYMQAPGEGGAAEERGRGIGGQLADRIIMRQVNKKGLRN